MSYEACADPARWNDFVQIAGQSCGAAGAALFKPGLDPELRQFSAFSGRMRYGVAEYFQHWAAED